MSSWFITTDDENFGGSLRAIVREEHIRFSQRFGSAGRKKRAQIKSFSSDSCKKFLQEVKRVINGEIKKHELLPVFLKQGDDEVPIKNLYELRVPDFSAFFRIDFESGQGRAIIVLRQPVNPAQVETLIRRWQHLE